MPINLDHNQTGDALSRLRFDIEQQFEEQMGDLLERKFVVIQNVSGGWVLLLTGRTRALRWIVESAEVEDGWSPRGFAQHVGFRVNAACGALRDRIIGPHNQVVNKMPVGDVE